MQTNVLITGASGYIGRNCFKHLRRSGFNVSTVSRKHILDEDGSVHHQIDSLENAPWDDILSNVDCVLHLAGVAHNPNASKDDIWSVNYSAVANLISASIRNSVRHFVFMSTIAVYGSNPQQPINEQLKARPVGDYAASKLAAELLFNDLDTTSNFAWTIIRVPMVYGNGAPGNFARLKSVVRAGIPLPLAGALERKSFISINNLTSALSHLISEGPRGSQTYNLADDEPISTAELVRAMEMVFRQKSRLWYVAPKMLQKFGALIGKRAIVDKLLEASHIDTSKFSSDYSWTSPYRPKAEIAAAIEA